MDGEEPEGEILVFISGSREMDAGQYSVFVKGGLLGLTSTWGGGTMQWFRDLLIARTRTIDECKAKGIVLPK